MKLNMIQPAEGSKKDRRRVGRGIGSGLGKTAGRGHKGQKSRAGGFHKVGFEGGQMPLQRRLPKRGFTSLTARFVDEINLNDLANFDGVVDLSALKLSGLISQLIRDVKVINTGKITRALTLRGIRTTAGAKSSIEAAGGKIEN